VQKIVNQKICGHGRRLGGSRELIYRTVAREETGASGETEGRGDKGTTGGRESGELERWGEM